MNTLHQGQMHLQSICAANIVKTFRANILKSVHIGRFELFWLPDTKHSWSKSESLTSLVGIALGKWIILHANTTAEHS